MASAPRSTPRRGAAPKALYTQPPRLGPHACAVFPPPKPFTTRWQVHIVLVPSIAGFLLLQALLPASVALASLPFMTAFRGTLDTGEERRATDKAFSVAASATILLALYVLSLSLVEGLDAGVTQRQLDGGFAGLVLILGSYFWLVPLHAFFLRSEQAAAAAAAAAAGELPGEGLLAGADKADGGSRRPLSREDSRPQAQSTGFSVVPELQSVRDGGGLLSADSVRPSYVEPAYGSTSGLSSGPAAAASDDREAPGCACDEDDEEEATTLPPACDPRPPGSAQAPRRAPPPPAHRCLEPRSTTTASRTPWRRR